VGMAFIVIAAIWFCFVPNSLGLYIMTGTGTSTEQVTTSMFIPYFNMNIWSQVIPLFVIVFSLCFVNQMIRFLVGRYNMTVMIFTIVLQTLSYILDLIILKGFPIWNTNGYYRVGSTMMTDETHIFPTSYFIQMTNIILIIIAIFSLIDIIKTVYCTVKYRN